MIVVLMTVSKTGRFVLVQSWPWLVEYGATAVALLRTTLERTPGTHNIVGVSLLNGP